MRNKITYMSYALSIIVVIRHSINYSVYDNLNAHSWIFFQRVIQCFTEVAVPSFFALSGYLFYQNFTYTKLKEKWMSRIKGLLVPYLIWSFLGYLYYLTLKSIPIIGNKIALDVPLISPRSILENWIYSYYNGPLWFVRSLLCFVFVTPLIYWIIKKWYAGASCLLISLVVGMRVNVQFLWYAYWLLGVCVATRKKEFIEKYSFTKIQCVIAILGLVILSVVRVMMPMSENVKGIVWLFEIVLVWIGMDIFRMERTPKWIFTISFFIYCTHSIILESIEKIILIVLGNNLYGSIVDLIFAPMITICFITFVAWIVNRKMPTVWKVITGNR